MSNHVVQMRVPAALAVRVAESDSQLVARLGGGDSTALDLLIRRHEPGLRRFVRGLVPEANVDDLVQETMMRAVAQLSGFRADARFTTWLFAIARFTCIDHLRRAGRTPFDDGFHAANELPNRTTPLERLPDVLGLGPDREAMGCEVRERVLDAVQSLPEPLRRVFLLRFLGELRFRDLAEMLGEGVPTVKSRMRYAVERLRCRVSEFEEWLTGGRRALS